MKKLILSLIFCLLFLLPSMADNIFMKNGTKIINVKVLNQDQKWIYYQMANGKKTKISKNAVLKIENIPFNPKLKSQIIAPDFTHISKMDVEKSQTESYPNFKLITLSIVSFALSYDYFKEANNIQKFINFNDFLIRSYIGDEKLEKEYLDLIDDLKSQKKRKQIIGTVFMASGIINAIISFKKVQIKASPQSLSLSYRF
ncbi:hypothetical protein Calab_1516 [Caldithrix abyssi DSM 13497]|uniref:Uncharacterized protein n=1 Tax=Caldithrix abyssi DSM 13497 TaxID=880073 RepID=H1XQJ0_CALAY|nr:hypothetical protein [Caldithrix abyssi]APF16979.1 hypothetical protein Cabys_228 [Caldithrix abyssi DSM 13497]APF20332.1 hypothetical protein Cabys_3586 [Caldithrix abyssi DSM 13497]EHO40382.1 hypothetical protein Calab_0743 [Caldithrix abyssi DSM 13497]EHO41136.1 hypothetical protein Calab_1516 [Caldithrix abyssi DSM 13497]